MTTASKPKTVSDIEKQSFAKVRSTRKKINVFSCTPFRSEDRVKEFFKLRRTIDRIWDNCQYLDPDRSEELSSECSNLVNELAYADNQSRDLHLLKIEKETDRLRSERDLTLERYRSEIRH